MVPFCSPSKIAFACAVLLSARLSWGREEDLRDRGVEPSLRTFPPFRRRAPVIPVRRVELGKRGNDVADTAQELRPLEQGPDRLPDRGFVEMLPIPDLLCLSEDVEQLDLVRRKFRQKVVDFVLGIWLEPLYPAPSR
jgi:hypothetical protein